MKIGFLFCLFPDIFKFVPWNYYITYASPCSELTESLALLNEGVQSTVTTDHIVNILKKEPIRVKYELLNNFIDQFSNLSAYSYLDGQKLTKNMLLTPILVYRD